MADFEEMPSEKGKKRKKYAVQLKDGTLLTTHPAFPETCRYWLPYDGAALFPTLEAAERMRLSYLGDKVVEIWIEEE